MRYESNERRKGEHILMHIIGDKDRDLAIKKNHSPLPKRFCKSTLLSSKASHLFNSMASLLNPYRVLLTHFFQRQSIIPVVDFVYPEPLPDIDMSVRSKWPKRHRHLRIWICIIYHICRKKKLRTSESESAKTKFRSLRSDDYPFKQSTDDTVDFAYV